MLLYAKPSNKRFVIPPQKNQNFILASIFNFISVHRFVQFSHSCPFRIRRYSPCCKPQDTTVYYGLVFARWNNNASVNSICAPPIPLPWADPRALDFFCLGWQIPRGGVGAPSSVDTATFFIDCAVE